MRYVGIISGTELVLSTCSVCPAFQLKVGSKDFSVQEPQSLPWIIKNDLIIQSIYQWFCDIIQRPQDPCPAVSSQSLHRCFLIHNSLLFWEFGSRERNGLLKEWRSSQWREGMDIRNVYHHHHQRKIIKTKL